MTSQRLRPVLLAMCTWLGLVAGCATTQPWERETLAKPVMAPDAAPRRLSLKQHYLSTREGSVGGFGGGGGGCGCN